MAAFASAMRLADPAVEPISVSFEGRPMPAWFARGAAVGEPRPLIILTNGYDGTVVDLYVAMGQAFRDRGYHCLFFDGPGQGSLLIRDGVAMVPDWERVVAPVVDAVVTRPDVDPARMILVGWSLGGYLALRAASGERRLAACVADPPLTSVYAGIPALAQRFGLAPAAVAALPELSDADQVAMMNAIDADPELRWKLVDRGFWVNGTTTLREYVASIYEYQLAGHESAIRCPVLATAAENDPLARGAENFVATLNSAGTVVHFSAAEVPVTTARCRTAGSSTRPSSTGSTGPSAHRLPVGLQQHGTGLNHPVNIPNALFDFAGVHIIFDQAVDTDLRIDFTFTDIDQTWTVWVKRGVLNARIGAYPDTQLTVSGPKTALVGAVLKPATAHKLAEAGHIQLDGDTAALDELAAVMDEFNPNFNIVTP